MPSFHRSSFRVPRSPRASVLILVVAVLALLVLMGTAYLVSARTDRANATSMSAANNIELARDGAMGTIVQTIGSSILDSAGKIGGYNSATGTYGNKAARNYDYPESNGSQAANNPNMPDEPWLVGHLHYPAAPTQNELSQLTPQLFNPSTGAYDLPPSPTYTVNVVHDQSTTSDADDPVTNTYDSYLNLLPFSDASGIRYRFGQRILDTSRMANLNTGSPVDSASVADTDGQYITSLRLAPDSASYPGTNYFYFANDGTYAPNLQATAPSASTSFGRTQNLSSNASPFASIYTAPGGKGADATWQSVIFQIEQPASTSFLNLFDLSDELELRSYGQQGTLYVPRPAVANASPTFNLWSNTLASNGTAGNPRRRNYTTYSFTREIRPYPDPANDTTHRFTLTPSGGTAVPVLPGSPALTSSTIWPQTYARIAVNRDLGISGYYTSPSAIPAAKQQSALGLIATTATNIATAMRFITDPANSPSIFPNYTVSGYNAFSPTELASYAANFITGQWNGFQTDPAQPGAKFLPFGPSFVDSNGICIRTADATGSHIGGEFSATTDVVAPSGQVVLGYAAQPFINEVAAAIYSQDGTTVTSANLAIELFNPYGENLSLTDYQLKVAGNTITLSGYVPAGGCYVISTNTNILQIDPSAQSTQDPGVDGNAASKLIVLYRKYYDRSSMMQKFAAVDQADFTKLTDPALAVNLPTDAASAVPYSMGRYDARVWGWAVNNFADPLQSTATLGTVPNNIPSNVNTASGIDGIVLYDRMTITSTSTPAYVASPAALAKGQGSQFANIADFEKIMRISNVVNATTGDPISLITDQLRTIAAQSASTPWSAMQYPAEAQAYFDFVGAPDVYNSSPPKDTTTTGAKPGDIRALRLFDHLAFLDRVSGDPATGSPDISKLRLPGQINVNTASGDVLRAIPNMTDQMVADVLSYRNRPHAPASSADPLASYNSIIGKDYSDTTKYPGRGIRSLAELMVPIHDTTTGSTPTTIPLRDATWAAIYNLCTVRSDTFVVYGYLEAVKANPAVTHDNAADWYRTVSDDPHDTTAKNIRVGKRRWVAIVDRSFCNYDRTSSNFAVPRVVAIKDLPQ